MTLQSNASVKGIESKVGGGDTDVAAVRYRDDLVARLANIHDRLGRLATLKEIARLSSLLGQREMALETWTSCLNYDRHDIEVLDGIANICIEERNWHRAWRILQFQLETLKKIGKFCPTPSFFNRWAIVGGYLYKSHMTNDQWKEAAQLLDDLIRQIKDDATKIKRDVGEFYHARGVCAYHLQDQSLALKMFKKIPVSSSYKKASEVYLLDYFKRSQQWDKRIAKLEHQIKLAGHAGERVSIGLQLAELLLAQKKDPTLTRDLLESVDDYASAKSNQLVTAQRLSYRVVLQLRGSGRSQDIKPFLTLYFSLTKKLMGELDGEQKAARYKEMAELADTLLIDKAWAIGFYLNALTHHALPEYLCDAWRLVQQQDQSKLDNSNDQLPSQLFIKELQRILKKIALQSPEDELLLQLEWMRVSGIEHTPTLTRIIQSPFVDQLPIDILFQLAKRVQSFPRIGGVTNILLTTIGHRCNDVDTFEALHRVCIALDNQKGADLVRQIRSLLTLTQLQIRTRFFEESQHRPIHYQKRSTFKKLVGRWKFKKKSYADLEALLRPFFSYINSRVGRDLPSRVRPSDALPLRDDMPRLTAGVLDNCAGDCRFYCAQDLTKPCTVISHRSASYVYFDPNFWQQAPAALKVFFVGSEYSKANAHYYFWQDCGSAQFKKIITSLSKTIVGEHDDFLGLSELIPNYKCQGAVKEATAVAKASFSLPLWLDEILFRSDLIGYVLCHDIVAAILGMTTSESWPDDQTFGDFLDHHSGINHRLARLMAYIIGPQK